MSLCQTVVFHSISVVAQMRFYVTTGCMFFLQCRNNGYTGNCATPCDIRIKSCHCSGWCDTLRLLQCYIEKMGYNECCYIDVASQISVLNILIPCHLCDTILVIFPEPVCKGIRGSFLCPHLSHLCL